MQNHQHTFVAVIGCGRVASYGHLPAIAQSPDLRLVAVADADPATVSRTASEYRVQGYEDYREILKRPEIAAISICTPLKFHYEVAKAALLAGKHVFCEKPLADTPEQGEELVDLARREGLMLGMNFGYRLEEGATLMREILLSGEIGELQVMRFVNNWGSHGVVSDWGGARRARGLQESGGCMDCAVHLIDLARFFSGSEIASMTTHGQWVETEYRYPGHALVAARMENGTLAHIECSYVYTHRSPVQGSFMQYDLIGERGVVTWCAPLRTPQGTFENAADEIHVYSEAGTRVVPFSSGKPFKQIYGYWADCLRRGSMEGSPLATGQDGNLATYWMWESLHLADRERDMFQKKAKTW